MPTRRRSETEYLAARDERLKRLKCDPSEIPKALTAAVFGDYLSTDRLRPKTLRRDVVAAFEKMPSVVELHQQLKSKCPSRLWGEAALMWAFNQHKDTALGNETATADSLINKLDLLQRVIRIEEASISTFLLPCDRRSLIQCIHGAATERQNRRQRRMRSLEDALFTMVPDKSVHDLLYGNATKERVKRFRVYPQDASAVASKLTHFLHTRGDRSARRAVLEQTFKDWQVELRADSSFCRAFIESLEDVDAEEVAAVMKITSRLFSHNHRVYSTYHHSLTAKLRHTYCSQNKPWLQACAITLEEFESKQLPSHLFVNSGGGYNRYDRYDMYDSYDSDGDY